MLVQSILCLILLLLKYGPKASYWKERKVSYKVPLLGVLDANPESWSNTPGATNMIGIYGPGGDT